MPPSRAFAVHADEASDDAAASTPGPAPAPATPRRALAPLDSNVPTTLRRSGRAHVLRRSLDWDAEILEEQERKVKRPKAAHSSRRSGLGAQQEQTEAVELGKDHSQRSKPHVHTGVPTKSTSTSRSGSTPVEVALSQQPRKDGWMSSHGRIRKRTSKAASDDEFEDADTEDDPEDELEGSDETSNDDDSTYGKPAADRSRISVQSSEDEAPSDKELAEAFGSDYDSEDYLSGVDAEAEDELRHILTPTKTGKAKAKPKTKKEPVSLWKPGSKGARLPKRREEAGPDCLPLPMSLESSTTKEDIEGLEPSHPLRNLYEVWGEIWADYLRSREAYEVTGKAELNFGPADKVGQNSFSHGWSPKLVRAMEDLCQTKDEIFSIIVQGISEGRLEILATGRHSNWSARRDILDNGLESTTNALWRGIYLLLLRDGAYVGSSLLSLDDRTRSHKRIVERLMNGEEVEYAQHVHKQAVQQGGHLDCKSVAVFDDHTPIAIIILAEAVMIAYLSTQRGSAGYWALRGGPKAYEIYLRSMKASHNSLPGSHENWVFPTIEGSHFQKLDPSNKICRVCGDSQQLQREHQYPITPMYFAYSFDVQPICFPCRRYEMETNSPRDFFHRPWYVREEEAWLRASCRNCGDEDANELLMKQDHNGVWEQAFMCEKCEVYRKKFHIPRPERFWKLHLRGSIRCQICGVNERHSPDPDVKVHEIHKPGITGLHYALCAACYGPDPKNKSTWTAGWTSTAVLANRRSFLTTTWTFNMWDRTRRGAPPLAIDPPQWDRRDVSKQDNSRRRSDLVQSKKRAKDPKAKEKIKGWNVRKQERYLEAQQQRREAHNDASDQASSSKI